MLFLFAARAQRAAAEALAARQATEIQAERGNLLEQAIYLDLNRNTPEAIARYKDLKAIYERIGEPSKSALTDILIGNTILFRAPNYQDPALPYFDNALKTARSQNVKFKPSIFVDIGDRLTESLPRDQAIAAVRFYDYASEVIPTENPEVEAEVLIKAADLYARSNKTDDLNNAVARYSEAIKLLSSTDPQQITINLRMGDALYAAHRIQEAREAYQKAAELARAAKNSADYGEALRRIADTYVSAEKDNAKAP
jgi:tetratricopeptide (TPR) repeat protein